MVSSTLENSDEITSAQRSTIDEVISTSYLKQRVQGHNTQTEDFIEMCFDPTTQANARLKEMLRKMMEENQGE